GRARRLIGVKATRRGRCQNAPMPARSAPDAAMENSVVASPAPDAATGIIVGIRGSVVDIRFDGPPPPINQMLRSGGDGEVVIEVADLSGPGIVKGLVFKAQHNLALGMPVIDTGGTITVPV